MSSQDDMFRFTAQQKEKEKNTSNLRNKITEIIGDSKSVDYVIKSIENFINEKTYTGGSAGFQEGVERLRKDLLSGLI